MDNDDDNDGKKDERDTIPQGIGTREDIDGDGISNTLDADIDGDGVANIYDDDIDGDTISNKIDSDDDNDDILDINDSSSAGIGEIGDMDGDGVSDDEDTTHASNSIKVEDTEANKK